MNPYGVTQELEKALSEYTGSRYAVCVNSGTAALLLACKRFPRRTVNVPKHTYCSVPQAVIHAGHKVRFVDKYWVGAYRLDPLPVWDCARRFTSGMHLEGEYECVSFSTSKILGAEQGGAILHDDKSADSWFRKMRFDGRTEGVDPMKDKFILGYHCIMLPSTAAELLLKLYHLPKHNSDLPYTNYPDLSKVKW